MDAPVTELSKAADAEALWSSTANTLKRRLTVARICALGLSIAGAAFTTVASQTTEPARHILAILGSAPLALAGIVAARFLGGAQIMRWVRARAASEGLKHEAWLYAVGAEPYNDPTTQDARLGVERERIEKDVDDLIDSAVSTSKAGSAPRTKVSRTEYFAKRVRKQAEGYYLPQGKAYHRKATRLRWFEVFLSFFAAALASYFGVVGKSAFAGFFAMSKVDFLAFTAVLTTIAGAITSHIEASRYEFLATSCLATARRLGSEIKSAGNVEAMPEADWLKLVSRCESIIRDENSSWLAKWTKTS